MGYKADDKCIEKAFDDERLFVLMARDVTAPLVIAHWISLNQNIQPIEKLREAQQCMIEMLERGNEFRERKKPLPSSPDEVRYQDCGECDGVGWYEGGPTIKTECKKCKGTGRVRC